MRKELKWKEFDVMEADFWDEKLGFDLWTDWLFEAVVVEEEELLKISCQSGKFGKVFNSALYPSEDIVERRNMYSNRGHR